MFDVNTAAFSKVSIKFSIPKSRDHFELASLTDGRVLVFGGFSEDVAFNNLYVLINYSINDADFMWHEVDTFGKIDKGYVGHRVCVLDNDHLIIFGGNVNAFNYFHDEVKFDPLFTNRVHVLDPFYSLEWCDTPKVVQDKTAYLDRIQHVAVYIPKEAGDQDFLFIHGGLSEKGIESSYVLFNLNENKFVSNETNKKEKSKNNANTNANADIKSPALKAHAITALWIKNRGVKEYYLIFSGGITIFQKKEIINGNLYCFNKNKDKFALVKYAQDIDTDIHNFDLSLLKRFGHNMGLLTVNGAKLIFILNGFIQFKGYVAELVILDITNEALNDGTEFIYKGRKIEMKNPFAGRINASVSVLNNKIIVYGGVKDNVVLGDLYVIDALNLASVEVSQVPIDNKVIQPRFAASSVIYEDSSDNGVARVIIFGGALAVDDLVTNMTNEIAIIKMNDNLEFSADDVQLDVYIPSVYGIAIKRVYHSAVLFENKMIVLGGTDPTFITLEVPFAVSYEITEDLNEYVNINKKRTYADWSKVLSEVVDDKVSMVNKEENTTFSLAKKRISILKSKNIENENETIVVVKKAEIDFKNAEIELSVIDINKSRTSKAKEISKWDDDYEI